MAAPWSSDSSDQTVSTASRYAEELSLITPNSNSNNLKLHRKRPIPINKKLGYTFTLFLSQSSRVSVITSVSLYVFGLWCAGNRKKRGRGKKENRSSVEMERGRGMDGHCCTCVDGE